MAEHGKIDNRGDKRRLHVGPALMAAADVIHHAVGNVLERERHARGVVVLQASEVNDLVHALGQELGDIGTHGSANRAGPGPAG